MWDSIINPFVTTLTFLYSLLGGNIILAIVVFTVLVRLITYPLTMQQQRSTKAMQQLQPELKKLQEKYKNDREKLAAYVRARKGAIQQCYEKELKRNPSLKGKVVVRFSITTSGRTGDIDIEENTTGNEAVASCIKTTIRGWVFPFKPESDVPVAYPFVFAPAS